MRKIDEKYENPIDHIFLLISESLCPIFYSLNFNANGITTLSLIFGLISIYYLYTGKVIMFMISYIISYFFDCMDGHFARKYNQVTKFGDYYDHITDVIKMISVIYTLYYINSNIMTFLIIPMIILLFFTSMHMG